jgi:dienelactone hydrolase
VPKTQDIICNKDGLRLVGELSIPDAPGPRPGVLVMPTAQGLGPHVRQAARDLAEQGYVAIAADMYGEGEFGNDHARTTELITPLFASADLLRGRVAAWLQVLKDRNEVAADRVGAIGYCFGGQCVIELARSGADVKVVVSYHGLLETKAPAQAGQVKAHVAVYTGTKDPYAPPEHVVEFRKEMIAAGADWQVTEFGNGYHSFTDPNAEAAGVPGTQYDPLLRDISWQGTLTLLRNLL